MSKMTTAANSNVRLDAIIMSCCCQSDEFSVFGETGNSLFFKDVSPHLSSLRSVAHKAALLPFNLLLSLARGLTFFSVFFFRLLRNLMSDFYAIQRLCLYHFVFCTVICLYTAQKNS